MAAGHCAGFSDMPHGSWTCRVSHPPRRHLHGGSAWPLDMASSPRTCHAALGACRWTWRAAARRRQTRRSALGHGIRALYLSGYFGTWRTSPGLRALVSDMARGRLDMVRSCGIRRVPLGHRGRHLNMWLGSWTLRSAPGHGPRSQWRAHLCLCARLPDMARTGHGAHPFASIQACWAAIRFRRLVLAALRHPARPLDMARGGMSFARGSGT